MLHTLYCNAWYVSYQHDKNEEILISEHPSWVTKKYRKSMCQMSLLSLHEDKVVLAKLQQTNVVLPFLICQLKS